MQYTYEITFAKDCMWNKASNGMFSAAPFDAEWKEDLGSMTEAEIKAIEREIEPLYNFSNIGIKGKTIQFKEGTMRVIKTKKGWVEDED
jgi:hypothetical protein